MKIISSKAAIADLTEKLPGTYRSYGTEVFVEQLHKLVLKQKVRFPILEHSARTLYETIPRKNCYPSQTRLYPSTK